MNSDFGFQQLVELCQRTHQEMQSRAGRTVDTFLVARNWLFGRYIVEYEQSGADRAQIYGKRLIDHLSKTLKNSGLRGISPTNLRKFREFYAACSEIQQTLSVESLSNHGSSHKILTDGFCKVPLSPSCRSRRTTHRRHPPGPPKERRPGRADSPQRRQHLCLQIPTIPTIQRGIESTVGKDRGRVER